MNRIEKLIGELCPDGVEWKELGEVVEILDYLRKPISKDKREFGVYPYYGANGVLEYVKDYIFDGTFLLFGEDGSVINKDGSPVLNWATGKIWVNNHAHVLSENKDVALLRYLYYYLCTIDVSPIVRGVPPKINQQNLRAIAIPIPPLPIQQEIVSILDTFTALDATLQAELEARSKQYEHYRDQLLSFEGKEVEWNILGEAIKIQRGVRVVRSQLLEVGEYPVYQNSMKPLGYFDKYNSKANTTFIICAGAAGDVGYSDVDFWAADDCFVCQCPERINSKFLYYFLLSNQAKLYSRVRRASVPRLSRDVIENLLIPTPPLSTQHRIVSILDKFDALVNTELPAEIAARRKQYEYYREKLLTFKPLKN